MRLNKMVLVRKSLPYGAAYAYYVVRHLRAHWLSLKLGEASEEYTQGLERANRLYEKCLVRVREFWEELQGTDPDVDRLPAIASSLRTLEDQANDAYLTLIHDYPAACGVLVAYAAFLEHVRGDRMLANFCLETAASEGAAQPPMVLTGPGARTGPGAGPGPRVAALDIKRIKTGSSRSLRDPVTTLNGTCMLEGHGRGFG